MPRSLLIPVLLVAMAGPACGPAAPAAAPPARYPFAGQVLSVSPERQELTVKHGDIEGLMPGMTMAFPVAAKSDMEGRVAGDLITATLEVSDSGAQLLNVVRTGSAPLPENTSEMGLLEGVLAIGDTVPDAALIDQTDRRRSLAEWKGTTTLVSFVYTSCPIPSYCPLMDRNFATLERAIAADSALAGNVKLISISIDPTRDTPAVLAAHADRLKADPAVWTFLTGDLPTVNRVAGRFGVSVVRPDTPGEISHNLRTTLIGVDGTVRELYPGNTWTVDDVLRGLRASVAAQ